jgi:predicted transposase YdaD
MEEFRSFVGQSPLVRKMLDESEAKGEAKGETKGRTEGAVEALQHMLVGVVQGRFPPLTELAQRKASEVTELQKLQVLVKAVSTAPDENVARWVLTTLAA